MIGKYSYEISHDDFVKGLSTNDDVADGGISPSSTGIDLFTKPGVVYPINAIVAKQSTVTDMNYIASCEAVGTPNLRVFLGSNRTLYGYKSDNTVASIGTSGGAETYTYFRTDMIQYNGKYYASSTLDVSEITSVGAFDEDWFSTRTGGVSLADNPHPMLNFNKFLYVASGNKLYKYDSDANVVTLVFTHSTETRILALDIDPSSGRMLVSCEIDNGNTGLTKSTAFVGYYDGTNPTQFLKKVYVGSRITAFYNLNGDVYAIAGQTLGIWNGNGVTFLRRLVSSQTDALTVGKQKISNMGQVLLLIDGTNVLAYGETIPGKKAFSNLATISPLATFATMGVAGPNQTTGVGYNILFGTNDGTTQSSLKLLTVGQTLVGTGTLYTNDTHFPRPKFIRGMDVFLEGAPGGSTAITFTYRDDIDTVANCSSSNTMTTAIGLIKKRFMFESKTTSLQLIASMVASTVGIRKIIVYFDDAE